jgi:uncharacterized protein YjhX (UPF0386 family)
MATRKSSGKTARRTTHRSAKGKKLYAERSATGRFEDVQSYERAHSSDIKRVSKAEAARKKTPRKTAAKKK